MKILAFSSGKDSMACLHLMRDELDCAIYVDTGFAYPEARKLVEYANTLLPVITVKTDRAGQNERDGIPADVLPIDWTTFGQMIFKQRDVKLQSYLNCCVTNIMDPLYRKALSIGATHIVFGQRTAEPRKSIARNGTVVGGIMRLHPIEDWSDQQVFDYLETKMEVPWHYRLKHSSLDCYDCTGYRRESQDRVDWMKAAHPELYPVYWARRQAVDAAVAEALHA